MVPPALKILSKSKLHSQFEACSDGLYSRPSLLGIMGYAGIIRSYHPSDTSACVG
jgi:hypothetical protein